MQNQLLRLMGLPGDIFELREYEEKYLLFCREIVLGEIWKKNLVLIPHINQKYSKQDPFYRLACLETIKYLREKKIIFKDTPLYIGEVPKNLDEQIEVLRKRCLQDDKITPKKQEKQLKLFLVGGKNVPREHAGVVTVDFPAESEQDLYDQRREGGAGSIQG